MCAVVFRGLETDVVAMRSIKSRVQSESDEDDSSFECPRTSYFLCESQVECITLSCCAARPLNDDLIRLAHDE